MLTQNCNDQLDSGSLGRASLLSKATNLPTDSCSGNRFHLRRIGEQKEDVGGEEDDSISGSRGVLLVNGRMVEEESEKCRDDVLMTSSTPSKRNKRKMSEPRKRRTDFSIRSLCSNIDEDDDEDEEEAYGSDRLKHEEESGSRNGEKRKRDSEESLEPVISTSRRENNFRNRETVSTTSVSSSSQFLPAGYHYIGLPMNAAAMVYQASCGITTPAISSLLSPFSLGSTDSIVGTTAIIDHRCSSDGSSISNSAAAFEPNCPDVVAPSPSSFRSDRSPSSTHQRRPRKNYKNMTKQRRVEANARERTRVHTISAAFDSLRRAVPSYSYNQRLSKLAILKIACSYILALARLAELDYGEGQSRMTFGECVDLCTHTIQAEGKAKRRH